MKILIRQHNNKWKIFLQNIHSEKKQLYYFGRRFYFDSFSEALSAALDLCEEKGQSYFISLDKEYVLEQIRGMI